MNTEEMEAVIRAEDVGEEIQQRSFFSAAKPWQPKTSIGVWFFNEKEYRVKPKPRRHWCNENFGHISGVNWETSAEAKSNAVYQDSEQIEFEEVIKTLEES